MREKHYKDQLSAFVDHELSKSDQQAIAEHLMQCSMCRQEHDAVRLGAGLAAHVGQHDSPPAMWNSIESALDGDHSPQIGMIREASRFGLRDLAGYAVAALVVVGLISAVYFVLIRPGKEPAIANRETPVQGVPEHTPMPELAVVSPEQPANAEQANIEPLAAGSNINAVGPTTASVATWEFETLSGKPKVGDASSANRLAVGDFLETDSSSRARLEVANIGSVEIQPNSLVKLVGTNAKEHRLSLERGVLEAQILAPPRLFIVDTPSAVAVDLGCAYKLEVDKAGNSYLHVTSGFVALERGGRESIVPAGAMCLTKRGKGLGTPFAADTTDVFRKALERFDFSGGGSRAIQAVLDNRNFYDIISLWHLLSRVRGEDREKVYDALATYVRPPVDVTRQGILTLDKKMLASWRAEVERAWFE